MRSPATVFSRRLLWVSVTFILATAKQLYAQTTWTGSVSTAWNTAGNWSAGVPDAADSVTIPNVTNDPEISVAGAVAKTVTVKAGGLLTIAAAGTITINGAAFQGFLNQGTVVNSGSIIIGNNSAVGAHGLRNDGIFTNNDDAQLQVERASGVGLFNTFPGSFTNTGTIGIGATAPAGSEGIYNGGVFNNNAGGLLFIDRVTNALVNINNNASAVFNNQGTINIGSIAGGPDIAYGISCHAPFNNKIGGQVNIYRCTWAVNTGNSIFNNAGTVWFAPAVNLSELIAIQETGMFYNKPFGVFSGTGLIAAVHFTNAGGTLSPGHSPGKFTFNASEDFDSSTMLMEVKGAGTPGVNYDQVVVNGTATLSGGDLLVSINYVPVNGDQVTLVSATSISGTFSNVSILPPNWVLSYTATAVILTFGTPPPPTAVTTWTGAVSTAWNTAGNWSDGVPAAADSVIIPNTTNDPVISVAGALAKTVTVQAGGLLTIGAAGTLTINGAAVRGLLNQGSVQNSGDIIIGNSSAVGANGLRNEGSFNNKTGALVQVERASSANVSNSPSGTFTNTGTIGIGTTVASGTTGIYNEGIFNNNLGGQCFIDRVSNGIETTGASGVFHNYGALHIGSLVGGSNNIYGIITNAPFNNHTGGQVNIDRVNWAFNTGTSTFNNDGTVTMGALSAVSQLISIQGTGMFNNKTGGSFYGTGVIAAARFTNMGGTLSPGYSVGRMTFNASENFDSSIMSIEVNGTGTPGVSFDQVFLNGTATLGGSLVLAINYTPANGDQVTIVSAQSISGTFSNVTGLPDYWRVIYTPTAVILAYDFINIWTGSLSNNWQNAGNWSTGLVPTAATNVVIYNMTNDPLITLPGAVARTIHVKPGASLTLNASGSLAISGVLNFNGINAALYNQGTVTIRGPLMVKPN
ncbi:MAG: hypothetical protein V4722_22370 [Bacteroidota bacterium]